MDNDTTRCCPGGDCDFAPSQTRKILQHIKHCRAAGIDPVESAHSSLTTNDAAPVWDGVARDYDSGTSADDDVLSVVAVLQVLDGGVRGVRAVCRKLCPYSLLE